MAKAKAKVVTEEDKQKHADLVAQAQKLGISVDGRTDKQLAASIKQASLQGDEHILGGEKSEVKAGKGHTQAHVYDRNDEILRTYTEEVHGDDFVDYANEFASKEEGRRVVTE